MIAFVLAGIHILAHEQIFVNDTPLCVEVARTKEEQVNGFMERTCIPDGTGMLFVYDHEQPLAFWMKNTKVPLTIAFFDRHQNLINMADMNPPTRDDLPVTKSKAPAQYALEVPQGWFDRCQIHPPIHFEWKK